MVSSFLPANQGQHILMYHSIGEPASDDPTGNYTVELEAFKQQMQLLSDLKIPVSGPMGPGASRPEVVLTFDDGYRDNLLLVAPILEKYHFPFTVFVVSDFIDSSNLYLSSAELKELSQLATIGLHGQTHRNLAKVDIQQVQKEIRIGKMKLESILGKEVVHFSYPHGGANREIRNLLQREKLQLGFCSLWGNNPPNRDPFMLKRIPIYASDSLNIFKQKVLGKWDWMGKIQKDPLYE